MARRSATAVGRLPAMGVGARPALVRRPPALARRPVAGTPLAVSALLPRLAACGGVGSSGGTDGRTAVGQVAPATVQLWHADDNAGAEGKVVAAWLPAFSAQFPQIKVEYQPRPSGWQDKLTAALVAGTPPDVV